LVHGRTEKQQRRVQVQEQDMSDTTWQTLRDAMEAPLGSPKHSYHIRRFSAAADQLAQVMRAKQGVQGNA
jgi:hypothetical protein